MMRIARYDILYDGCYAHVISRSIRKMKIFNDEKDFDEFKRNLKVVKTKRSFKLFHYCIMQTHFHLAVEMINVKEFSSAMRDLKRSYVYWFHNRYKLSGPIWRERFRSLMIEDESYMNACGKYIEENPSRAGIVKASQDWKFSSSRHYLEGISDELIDKYEGSAKEIRDLTLDNEEFENGRVIGSSFFKFRFEEKRKRSRRVP